MARISLILAHVFLGLGGIGGGLFMIIDPSGQLMGLPSDLLEPLFISSFILPGLFLILVMGILPLLTAYGFWKYPDWKILSRLNPFSKYPWYWVLSLTLGILLIGWILFQLILWGSPIFIQTLYLIVGAAVTFFTLISKSTYEYSA